MSDIEITIKCLECRGSGRVYESQGSWDPDVEAVTCAACDGSGLQEPRYYLLRVPDAVRLDGLDSDRWVMLYPARNGEPAEAIPITTHFASELFADDAAGICTAAMEHVRRDLAALAAVDARAAA